MAGCRRSSSRWRSRSSSTRWSRCCNAVACRAGPASWLPTPGPSHWSGDSSPWPSRRWPSRAESSSITSRSWGPASPTCSTPCWSGTARCRCRRSCAACSTIPSRAPTRHSADALRQVLGPTVSAVLRTAAFVLGLIVVPVWLFFVLKDREALPGAVRGALPAAWRADADNILNLLAVTGGRWVRGQLLLGAAIFAATLVGLSALWLAGFTEFGRFTLVLAVVAGVLEWFPIIGPIIAAIPALLVAPQHQSGRGAGGRDPVRRHPAAREQPAGAQGDGRRRRPASGRAHRGAGRGRRALWHRRRHPGRADGGHRSRPVSVCIPATQRTAARGGPPGRHRRASDAGLGGGR